MNERLTTMNFKLKKGNIVHLLGWGKFHAWEVLGTRIDYSFKHAPQGIGKYKMRHLDHPMHTEIEFCQGDVESSERCKEFGAVI